MNILNYSNSVIQILYKFNEIPYREASASWHQGAPIMTPLENHSSIITEGFKGAPQLGPMMMMMIAPNSRSRKGKNERGSRGGSVSDC